MRLFTAGHLRAGPADRSIPAGGVLVDGPTIVAVGPAEELAAQAPTAERRDYPASTIIPGLVDSHVHLAFTPGTPLDRVADEPAEQLLATITSHAHELLNVGVTTARDVGDRGGLATQLRDQIASGHQRGPTLLCAGPPLTRRKGHCWFLGGEVDGDPGHAEPLRHAVRRVAATGADLVKVMASGGHSTEGGAAMWQPQFSPAELATLVDEASAHGLPVAAHAHGIDSIDAAVHAGVHTLEHCSWMSEGLHFITREQAHPTVERIAARHITVCPGHPNSWDFFNQIHGEADATEILQRIRWLTEQGVRVVHGTDAGLAPFSDSTSALVRLNQFGFSGADLLDMATVHPAEALGLARQTGRLEPKLRADLLVLPDDPCTEPTALQRPTLVVAAGHEHQPT